MVHKRNQVLPLRDGRVLKFVHKDMAVSAAHALEEKRHRVVPNHTGHTLVQSLKETYVLHLLNAFNFLRKDRKGSDQINLGQQPAAQQVGLSASRPSCHGLDLLLGLFCEWPEFFDGCDDMCRRIFRCEYTLLEHVLEPRPYFIWMSQSILVEPIQKISMSHFFGRNALVFGNI